MIQKNFIQILLQNFSQYADEPVMMFKAEGRYRTVPYRDLEEIVFRIAGNLMAEGLRPRDRIALFSNNRPEWAQADLGSLLAGAISSAIYASLTSEEAAFIINDLEASILFVEGNVPLEKILTIRPKIPSVKKVFVFGSFENPDPAWVVPFSRLLEGGKPSPELRTRIHAIVDAIDSSDPMCIIYTSGTTGNPKGVVLTYDNYLRTLEMLTERVSDISRLYKNLSFLPLAHAFERFAGYYLVLYMGRCIAYAESIETVIDNLKEAKPNFFVAVPRVFEKVHARITQGVRAAPPLKKAIFYWALGVGQEVSRLTMKGRPVPSILRVKHRIADRLIFSKVRAAFGGEIEFCVSGGAPLSKEIAEFFHAMGILIIEGWGATEATTPSTLNVPYEYRFGTVGKALPGVEVRVAADGELEVRGTNVFKEYWRNPEETKATFTDDGFYRTGDIGEIDGEGWVTITDRKKQLIITSGGKNIAPAPIENLLLSGRHIETAYVHGDRRHYLTALLVLDEGAVKATAKHIGIGDLSWPDLVRHPRIMERVQKEVDRANEQLPRFMQIKYFRVLPMPFTVETGELTPTMKMKKRVIEEKYRDVLDGMYTERE